LNKIGTNTSHARFSVSLFKRKAVMFNPWQFGIDVQHVMTRRVLRMMAGNLTSREAGKMTTEKHKAFSNAQILGAYALRTEGPIAAGREMIGVYQRAVSANCARLASTP
jgi:hypothetical protein